MRDRTGKSPQRASRRQAYRPPAGPATARSFRIGSVVIDESQRLRQEAHRFDLLLSSGVRHEFWTRRVDGGLAAFAGFSLTRTACGAGSRGCVLGWRTRYVAPEGSRMR